MMHTGATTLLDTAEQVDYAQALTLVGQVIALHARAIAREQSRPWPDREFITRLERDRHEAVELCRRLSSSDPEQLSRVVREYSIVHQTLLALTRI
jgi:hypothetical protein